MDVRIFLILAGLGSAPYGIYCAIHPGFVEGFAGIAATSTTGTVELVAMYGGLQTALGVLALVGAFRPVLTQAALLATAFQFSGLGFVSFIRGYCCYRDFLLYRGGPGF